jgi:hypothetical protein
LFNESKTRDEQYYKKRYSQYYQSQPYMFEEKDNKDGSETGL